MATIPTLVQAVDPASVEAAAEVSRRSFALFPEAVERYGEHGRAYTDRDDAYLVQSARDAVDLRPSSVFERNVRCLSDLLAARDFPTDWFLRDLDLVLEMTTERGLIAPADADALPRPLLAELSGRR